MLEAVLKLLESLLVPSMSLLGPFGASGRRSGLSDRNVRLTPCPAAFLEPSWVLLGTTRRPY